MSKYARFSLFTGAQIDLTRSGAVRGRRKRSRIGHLRAIEDFNAAAPRSSNFFAPLDHDGLTLMGAEAARRAILSRSAGPDITRRRHSPFLFGPVLGFNVSHTSLRLLNAGRREASGPRRTMSAYRTSARLRRRLECRETRLVRGSDRRNRIGGHRVGAGPVRLAFPRNGGSTGRGAFATRPSRAQRWTFTRRGKCGYRADAPLSRRKRRVSVLAFQKALRSLSRPWKTIQRRTRGRGQPR